MPVPLVPLAMAGVKFAAGAAVKKTVAATVIGALTSKAGLGFLSTAAVAGAKSYAAKQAATAVATRAAATIGLGAVAASAVPWVVGGITIWQLGKLGCKLLDNEKKGD